MGLIARVVKGAGVDPEDGMICGEFTWDQESRLTYHGSDGRRVIATAQGNLRRMNEKPKLTPWSREVRRP